MVERLQQLGVEVERLTELLGYSDDGDGVRAQLRGPDGAESEAQADYIAGCDGARSKVREGMGTGFPGGTYPNIFYVADVVGHGPAFNGDLNVELDESDFLAVFPLAHDSRIRLIGAIRRDEHQNPEQLTFNDISDRAVESLKLQIDKVKWFSTYHVHHRVTDRFRAGRAFLLGDAAHIHTPVGGQGMNTGIGDAINLAWKLKAVLDGRAHESLLDTFEAERRAFAVRLVQTTDRVFVFASAEGHLAEVVRHRIAPLLLPQVVKLEAAREFIFRTLSQITLNYRGKGLNHGHAGPVHGGDRLPWLKLSDGDNYAALERIGWGAQVYGAADGRLKRWCEGHGVPLQVYPWASTMREAGLREDALYLTRPDTYVALAQDDQDVASLDRYFETIQIQP